MSKRSLVVRPEGRCNEFHVILRGVGAKNQCFSMRSVLTGDFTPPASRSFSQGSTALSANMRRVRGVCVPPPTFTHPRTTCTSVQLTADDRYRLVKGIDVRVRDFKKFRLLLSHLPPWLRAVNPCRIRGPRPCQLLAVCCSGIRRWVVQNTPLRY